MSVEPFPSEFLLVRPSEPQGPWEVWLDWNTALDGDLSAVHPVLGWRVECCLLVRAPQEIRPRRVGPFEETDWDGIKSSGLLLVICGPSGELARCKVRLLDKAPVGFTEQKQEEAGFRTRA